VSGPAAPRARDVAGRSPAAGQAVGLASGAIVDPGVSTSLMQHAAHAAPPHPRRQDHSDVRRSRRTGRRPALLALVLAAVVALTAPSAAGRVRPLVNGDVPDPSIAQTKGKHYVVVGTGEQVLRLSSSNGRRWQLASPALVTRPSWARATGSVWASDIVRLRGRWVLYFAAPVRGLGINGRCIGVAVASSPTGQFLPTGSAPLVCPPDAKTPLAGDPVLDAGRTEPTLPTAGAIDPSLFQDRTGTWLLYKTDGVPSSVRIVQLTPNGLQVAGGSRAILASTGVVENPVMLRRGAFYYLFTSVGDYTTCGYGTVYRRSRDLLSWRGHSRALLTQRTTHLCGPGGADLLVQGRGRNVKVSLYFHGWVCGGTGRPCRTPSTRGTARRTPVGRSAPSTR
jgi:arabinan endo-1,5-alpha-L-arabinosidase